MTERLAHINITHAGPRLHFVRHLVEMMVAMWIGMPLGRGIFAALYGSASNSAVQQHDIAWTLLIAVAMTVPMVAVMLYRRHSRRSAGEMAAAMIAPALPFVALKISHVITGPVAGRGVHLFDLPANRTDLHATEFVHPTGSANRSSRRLGDANSPRSRQPPPTLPADRMPTESGFPAPTRRRAGGRVP
jgi:hypothetical protein